jgi:transmembrane sensor
MLQANMKSDEANERKWFLAGKVLTDGLAPDEKMEWEEFLRDQNFRSQFENMARHWENAGTLPYEMISKEEGWRSVSEKIAPLKGTLPVWRYAAVVALCILAGIVAYQFGSSQGNSAIATTIDAPNGARTSIMLPDSSRVYLNAGSRISFADAFGSKHRHIDLQGEAFFDVKKSKKPFTVHTKHIDITVLGTAFNISAYPGDEAVSTTLVRGSLKVTRSLSEGRPEEVILKPNQKITMRLVDGVDAGQPMTLQAIDGLSESEWKDGWLTVRGASLSELSRKIERLYNVRVSFTSESLKSFRYNGRIQQLSLEQVLTALALTSPVKFTIKGKEVVFSENELTKSKYETH